MGCRVLVPTTSGPTMAEPLAGIGTRRKSKGEDFMWIIDIMVGVSGHLHWLKRCCWISGVWPDWDREGRPTVLI